MLTTYAILRLDIESLGAREWDTVVLDKAQAIKNPTSKVARAAYKLRAKFKVALTGTPVENHLEDLWSQFHYLQPGLLGGRSEFSDRYVKSIAVGDDEAAKPRRAGPQRAQDRLHRLHPPRRLDPRSPGRSRHRLVWDARAGCLSGGVVRKGRA